METRRELPEREGLASAARVARRQASSTGLPRFWLSSLVLLTGRLPLCLAVCAGSRVERRTGCWMLPRSCAGPGT